MAEVKQSTTPVTSSLRCQLELEPLSVLFGKPPPPQRRINSRSHGTCVIYSTATEHTVLYVCAAFNHLSSSISYHRIFDAYNTLPPPHPQANLPTLPRFPLIGELPQSRLRQQAV